MCQRNGKYVGRREVLAGMPEAPPHHLQVGEGGTGMGGPLPLSPVSLLEMDEENKVLSRVAGSTHMGGGLDKGKRGRPLRLSEGVSDRTETASKELLGRLRQALEIWNGVGYVRRPGRTGMGLETICTQNYVVPCFLKGQGRSH